MAERTGKTPTLASLLEQRGPLPEHQVVLLFMQVLEDLELNHSQAQLHLDVKPSKIIRTVKGTYKLADYGMSRLGTARYMSPERAERKKPDGRSDIYSLGVVMYETATGKPPFEGELNYQLLDAHVNLTPPMPRSVKPEISGELQRIILTALAKDPRARYQSAKDFKQALEGLKAMLVSRNLGQTPVPGAKKRDKPTRPEEIIQGEQGREPASTPAKTMDGVMAGRRPGGGDDKPGKRGKATPGKPAAGMPKPQPRPQRLDSKARRGARGKRVSPLVWIIPVALVLVVAVVYLALPKGIKVPDLVGLPREQAEERVKAAGLEFAVNGEKDAPLAKELVVEQNIGPGERTGKGSTIAVFLSTGVVSVPKLAGMTLSQAREEVTRNGLVVGKVDTTYNDRAQHGSVLRSRPDAGAKVAAGAKVTLTVVAGRATCPECGRRRERGGKFCISCGYKYEL